MTKYIRGSTVWHTVEYINHRDNRARSHCGRNGEPVEADPDDEELCSRCRSDEEADE